MAGTKTAEASDSAISTRKPTKGPWEVREGDGNYLFEVVGQSPRGKKSVVCRPAGLDREANAHLIAAAPSLLEALKWMVLNMKEDGHDYRDCYRASLAAIAKAEGR